MDEKNRAARYSESESHTIEDHQTSFENQKTLLEMIFDTIPAGLAVFAGKELIFHFANPAFRELTPQPEIDPVGRRFDEIWSPEEGRRMKRVFQRIMKTGQPVQIERFDRQFPDHSLRTYSFELHRLSWNGGPAMLAVLWETTDLEDAKYQAEVAAAEAQRWAAELDAVFNSMSEAVFIYDARGIPRQANPAAISILGFNPVQFTREEFIQKLSIRHPDGRLLALEELPYNQALRGEKIEGKRLLITGVDGANCTILASAAPLVFGGLISGVVSVWYDVTIRERLLEQLESEQARLRAILENAPEAIVVADRSGWIVMSNPAAARLFSRPHQIGEEHIPPVDLQLCYPDGTAYDALDLPLMRSALAGETYADVDMIAVWPDGQKRFLLVSSAPIRDKNGRVNGAVSVSQDVTQQKQAEETLRKHAAQAEVMLKISQSFAEAGLDYTAVLNTIARQIAEFIGEACIISLVSEDGKWLDPVAYHFIDPEAQAYLSELMETVREQADHGLAGRVFQTGQALLIPFVPLNELKEQAAPQFKPWLERFPVRSILIVPLRTGSRLIGTLSMLRFQPFDPYTADDQIFFQNLANRAALAIENARLYLAEAQRARELDALHTATTALLTTLDLEALLGYILDAAMSAIPAAEGGSLHLIARDTGQLQVRAVHGYNDPRIRKFSLPGSKGYAARAVKERKSLLIDDLQEETGILEDSGFSDMNAARSIIVAPLLVGEHVLGAIALDSPKVGAFGETDLRLLVSFATTTTTAIQNATLHSEVQKQAITDTLTGLYNRRGFFELSQREIDRVRRFGHPLSAIMLDIDHFKLVNDTYTHAVGDEVLQLLAERLRNSLREVDILGRYGGEEFVILLPETDLFGACTIAERLRKSVEETGLTTSTGPISITVSLGVTRATPSTTDLSELINQADIALYSAKQAGRNRVEVG